jgi:phosphoribosylformylglycinamidine (FGAM) synthase PurS component
MSDRPLIPVLVFPGSNDDRDAAGARVREMCERLLANGVIEDFRVELAEDGR